MQMCYRVGWKHSHGYLLGNNSLAVAPTKVVVERCIESIVVVCRGGRECAIRVRGRGGDNGEGEHGQIVLLREANMSRRRVDGRLQCAIERRERDLEVDYIVRCRLHADCLEDGVLRHVLAQDWGTDAEGLQWRERYM